MSRGVADICLSPGSLAAVDLRFDRSLWGDCDRRLSCLSPAVADVGALEARLSGALEARLSTRSLGAVEGFLPDALMSRGDADITFPGVSLDARLSALLVDGLLSDALGRFAGSSTAGSLWRGWP